MRREKYYRSSWKMNADPPMFSRRKDNFDKFRDQNQHKKKEVRTTCSMRNAKNKANQYQKAKMMMNKRSNHSINNIRQTVANSYLDFQNSSTSNYCGYSNSARRKTPIVQNQLQDYQDTKFNNVGHQRTNISFKTTNYAKENRNNHEMQNGTEFDQHENFNNSRRQETTSNSGQSSWRYWKSVEVNHSPDIQRNKFRNNLFHDEQYINSPSSPEVMQTKAPNATTYQNHIEVPQSTSTLRTSPLLEDVQSISSTGSQNNTNELEDIFDLTSNSDFLVTISASTAGTQTDGPPAKKKRKRLAKKNTCALCDMQGHTEMQCQMICKNCNGNYHNMRTCTQGNKTQKTLANFLDFCVKQFISQEIT